MMSLHHLPKSLIVSVWNLESRSDMSPPTHIECALTYSGLKLTCVPVISTAVLRALVILVLQMADHFFLCFTEAIGMWTLVS